MFVFLIDIITQYSLWLLPCCIAGGLLFAGLMYYGNQRNKELSKIIKSLLFVLRTILVSVLLFFLLDPFIKRMVNEKEKPLIIIAQDNSSSLLNNKDSVFMKGEYLKSLKGLADRLSEKYDVRSYRFSDKSELNDTINFEGKETDFSSFFDEVENNYSNRNVGAIVFASDGLFNKGINPVYTTGKMKVPVYTIGLGDTTVNKDLSIKKVDHNEVAYLGNKFPVEVTIDAKKLNGKETILSVNKDGKKLAEQKIKVQGDAYTQTFRFMLDADKPGVQKYSLSLNPLKEELNVQNNFQSFVIEVIDTREKIAIITSAPHPDVAAIKESIESNQNYEVDVFMLNDFNASVKPYSLVFLNQVQLSSAQGTKIMNDLTANNTSWFLLSAYGSDKIPGFNVQAMSLKYNDAEAVIAKGFSLFTISEELKKYAKDFPAVNAVMGNYSITNSVNTMFNQRIGIVETENPLLAFNSNGEQKSGVFLGDGLWKWKLRDFADHQNHNLFNELIGKIVQYLSVKADKSFFRVKSKKIINENEPVEIEAEVYNNAYELITEPDVTLSLVNENDQKFDYAFSKTGLGYRLNLGTLPPGEYSYKANTNNGTKSFEKRGVFTVKEITAERMQMVADHQLLSRLANKTAGKFFYPKDLSKLTDDLLNNESIKTITYSHKDVKELIDVKAIFFVLLILLSVEWFMRKYNGLY